MEKNEERQVTAQAVDGDEPGSGQARAAKATNELTGGERNSQAVGRWWGSFVGLSLSEDRE
ncbi:TPA: hypothetical protein ACUT97_006437 [Pseudomonas aeruginosa]|uniref:hypothetical protein n=1 Tax=Pseudomonas aeruginosa TaxID=287 RepID=UPI001E51D5DB|nr:hypothetical protein [Pseudomonas aeruginosa]